MLDVDRYPINGRERDVVVAARELHLEGLPDAQKKWANEKTVYTHGYGLIAAYGNQRNADDQPVGNDGEPVFAEEDLPPQGQISDLQKDKKYRAQIYFGEHSPTYSVVGKAPGGKDVELDVPQGSGTPGQSKTNTYTGEDGVGIGNMFRKLLYATKFGDANLVLSSRVNENSKILYDRSPARARAEGRALADRRLRRAAGRGRRQDRVDPRRLHHQRQVPAGGEEVAAGDDLRRGQPALGVRHPADRQHQLHAQRGQGHGRRLRRHA